LIPDANNPENDLTIIASVLGTLTDDAGNSVATATSLSLPVTDHEGQITPDGLFADVDVYSFSASGATHVEVKPLLGDEGESRAANLAMNVTLQDSSASVIASMTSSDNSPLDPTTNILVYDGTLAADTYYLLIDAVSPDTNWATGFDEYGNGGEYRLSISSSGGGTPGITSPTPGSTLSGATETFTWSDNGASVSNYWLYIGSSVGASDIHDSGDLGTATSTSVSGLPTDGSTVYVRLWYQISGSWLSQDYTYTAFAGGGTPGITSPTPGSTLTDATQTFIWSDNGASVSNYWLYIGSSVGASDIHDSGDLGTATSTSVSGLPTDGSTVYVRFWYQISGSWLSRDYTYTAFTAGGTPGITSPTPGSTLTDATETFTWSDNGASVSKYWLYIGFSVGENDIHDSGDLGTATSTSVSGLPTDGSTVYVRFWYYIGVLPILAEGEEVQPSVQAGSWYYEDYTYTAATGSSGFDEEFNGDISNWDQHSGVWTNYDNWALHAADASQTASLWATVSYNLDTYSDLDYSVPLWRNGDDGSANTLFIRSDNTFGSDGVCSTCYLFQYARDGYYSVWKGVSGGYTALQSWTFTSAINQGSDWNHLRVVAQGANLDFYINATLVWSGTDSTLTSGRVGISAYKSTSLDLWVDWATLTMPIISSTSSDVVSEEQQQLNEAANANPVNYDPRQAPKTDAAALSNSLPQ